MTWIWPVSEAICTCEHANIAVSCHERPYDFDIFTMITCPGFGEPSQWNLGMSMDMNSFALNVRARPLAHVGLCDEKESRTLASPRQLQLGVPGNATPEMYYNGKLPVSSALDNIAMCHKESYFLTLG